MYNNIKPLGLLVQSMMCFGLRYKNLDNFYKIIKKYVQCQLIIMLDIHVTNKWHAHTSFMTHFASIVNTLCYSLHFYTYTT